jgi:endonuclease-3 related protein
MPTLDDSWTAILSALAAHYGPPLTVPMPAGAGPDPFSSLVAVSLTRAGDPRRATRGVDALAEAGLLDPRAVAGADLEELRDVLRSSGFNVPARGLAPIVRLARWFLERHAGAGGLAGTATESLREELVALNGIGQATADALLLHGLGRPVYPVDRATYRVLVRHGWLDPSADYDAARSLIEHPSRDRPETLARLSEWFTRIGRDYCRPGVAKCDRCPLRPFLPEGGPVEPEGFAPS